MVVDLALLPRRCRPARIVEVERARARHRCDEWLRHDAPCIVDIVAIDEPALLVARDSEPLLPRGAGARPGRTLPRQPHFILEHERITGAWDHRGSVAMEPELQRDKQRPCL